MKPRPIFYDTETTGIDKKNHAIIELAAYDPERNRTFDELIDPGMPIPSEATAIHGISDDMVAGKPSFQNIAEKFVAFCEGPVILIAHNNDAFDFPFLQSEFAKHSVSFPFEATFDTLKWARRYRGDLPRHTLQILREAYGIPANNAHRALDDVMVLYEVYRGMLDDLSIEEAISLLHREILVTTMPFGKYKGQPLEKVPGDYIRWLQENGALDKKENEGLRKSLEKIVS